MLPTPENISDEKTKCLGQIWNAIPQSPYQTDEAGTITTGSYAGSWYTGELRYKNTELFFYEWAKQKVQLELKDLGSKKSSPDVSSQYIYDVQNFEEQIQGLIQLHSFLETIDQASVDILENIDWKKPESIKAAIDFALADGHHSRAMELITEGCRLFPEEAALQKIARILAPPKVIRTDVPPSVGLGKSMKWLKENHARYQGQWVAVKHGLLLGHASSRQELSEMLNNVDTSDTIITKVPEYISG